MKKVVRFRKEFPKCPDVSAKREMAKEELDSWVGYMESRKEDLPNPDFTIEEKEYSLLKENFDRLKVRNLQWLP